MRKHIVQREKAPLTATRLASNSLEIVAHQETASAVTAASQGDLLGACVHFRRALAAVPSNFEANLQFAQALRLLGKTADAIEHFRKALTKSPTSAVALHGLGKALSTDGRVLEAIAQFRRAAEYAPTVPEIYNDLGLALWEVGLSAEAEECLRRAIDLNPGFSQPWFNLHSALLANGRPLDAAIACLSEHCRLKPRDLVARAHLHVLRDYEFRRAHPVPALDVESPDTHLARACLQGYREVVSASPRLPTLLGGPAQAFQVGFSAARQKGLVLEFGVRFGTSLRLIAALAEQPVHGFDSFQGLPESWHQEAPGSYSTQGAIPSFEGDVSIHAGWFAQSLPEFLQVHSDPVRLVHIDCDLYSSTRTVLALLKDRMRPGAIPVFDDFIGHTGWEKDEFKAFQEAATEASWDYEYLAFSVATGQVVIRLL